MNRNYLDKYCKLNGRQSEGHMGKRVVERIGNIHGDMVIGDHIWGQIGGIIKEQFLGQVGQGDIGGMIWVLRREPIGRHILDLLWG